MKSFFLQCSLAPVVAAGTSASLSLAQDVPARPGIAAQISALGLDQAAVKASLEGLGRDARISYLQNLGVRLPDSVTRSVTAVPLADGAVSQNVSQLTNVRLENAGTLKPVTLPEGEITIQPWPLPGQVTILPWPLPSNVGDGGAVRINPGSLISSDGKVIDARLVAPGVAATVPANIK